MSISKWIKKREKLQTVVYVTGQHRQTLDQVLETFCVVPDYDLSIIKEKQTLFDITANIMVSRFLLCEIPRRDRKG